MLICNYINIFVHTYKINELISIYIYIFIYKNVFSKIYMLYIYIYIYHKQISGPAFGASQLRLPILPSATTPATPAALQRCSAPGPAPETLLDAATLLILTLQRSCKAPVTLLDAATYAPDSDHAKLL